MQIKLVVVVVVVGRMRMDSHRLFMVCSSKAYLFSVWDLLSYENFFILRSKYRFKSNK